MMCSVEKTAAFLYINSREAVSGSLINSVREVVQMCYVVPILMSAIVLLFVVCGIVIKYKRYYWLISGYNTMPVEKKKNVDIVGLSKFIGNFCFIIAGVLLLAGIMNHFNVFYGFVIAIASLFFIVAYMLIRAQKYHNGSEPGHKPKPAARLVLSILALLLIIVGGALIYGSAEQTVSVSKDRIRIGGIYGTALDMNEITDVFLIRALPQIQRKTEGFDFGNTLKGDFELKGFGEGKLFLNTRTHLFINMKYGNSFVILNFRDSMKTLELYDNIRSVWNK